MTPDEIIYHHMIFMQNWYALAWCRDELSDEQRGYLYDRGDEVKLMVEAIEGDTPFAMWLTVQMQGHLWSADQAKGV